MRSAFLDSDTATDEEPVRYDLNICIDRSFARPSSIHSWGGRDWSQGDPPPFEDSPLSSTNVTRSWDDDEMCGAIYDEDLGREA
jgi:hypothetical protein